MDEKLKQILNDLYMIDGSLKKQEKEVEQIVSKLLESKPNVRIDDNFVRQLRAELALRAKAMNAIEPKKQGVWDSIFSGRKLAYSFTAVVMVLVAIASVSYLFGRTGSDIPGKIAVSNKEVSKVKDRAFGSLSLNQPNAPLGLGGGVGGGGGGSASSRSESGGGGGSDTKIAGFYGPVNYHYIYKGGDISVSEDKIAVYKRIKEIPLGDRITGTMKNIDFGLVNLGKFDNTGVSMLTVSENKDFGYEVTLDYREGAIYINPNWVKWPNPNIGCGRDQSCYERNQLKESDIPSKENLTAIADKFLSDYGIDKSSYGEPVVIESYGWVPDGVGKKLLQVPEIISVVYPLEINGQLSYDQSGNPDGMVIDVNIRHKKVASARNIFLSKFESSDYAAETNKAKIISFAEGGGLGGNYGYPEAQKTIEVELGTPKVGLATIWRFEESKGSAYSLYVPAYIFPITRTSEEGYIYYKSVVVPMAKEMLERPDGGIGIAEPLLKAD